MLILFPPLLTGKDEGEEQAGPTTAGHNQGVGDAGGREDQGRGAGVASDHGQEMGRLAQELHSGTVLRTRACDDLRGLASHIQSGPCLQSQTPSACVKTTEASGLRRRMFSRVRDSWELEEKDARGRKAVQYMNVLVI